MSKSGNGGSWVMGYGLWARLLIALLFMVSLTSCGGGGGYGAPGTSGKSGILVKSISISMTSPDVDVYSSPTACDGKAEQDLTRETAVINFNAGRFNERFDSFPASVEICTVSYRKAVEDPGSPLLQSLTTFPNCTVKEGDNECQITIIDIQRKQDYWKALANGLSSPKEYPTHYVATVNCDIKDIYGDIEKIQVEQDVWLADFKKCGS